MGHEIERHDTVVLEGQAAWHGLGHVIPKGKSPKQLVAEYEGLGYTVDQLPLFALNADGKYVEVTTHVANYRADIDEVMGIVGSGYEVVQNMDLAEFAEALAKVGEKVVCETAGTIRNGRRVWFLCKAPAFEIGKGRQESDVVMPYLLIANGHDGGLGLRVQPTTVRVVCSNTLHMVVPRFEQQAVFDNACFVAKHTKNVMERLEEAKRALAEFQSVQEQNRRLMQQLADSQVNKKKLAEFFVESYSEDHGEIPNEDDETRSGKSRRARAVSAWESFTRRWDDEESKFGANGWTAFNAYSGLVQHDKKARGTDDVDRVEKRVHSNLFGLNAERTSNAFQRALSLLVG